MKSVEQPLRQLPIPRDMLIALVESITTPLERVPALPAAGEWLRLDTETRTYVELTEQDGAVGWHFAVDDGRTTGPFAPILDDEVTAERLAAAEQQTLGPPRGSGLIGERGVGYAAGLVGTGPALSRTPGVGLVADLQQPWRTLPARIMRAEEGPLAGPRPGPRGRAARDRTEEL